MIRPYVIPKEFEGKISISLNKGGCWKWLKSTREGYGQLMVNKVPFTAHRFSYTYFYGEIPKGMVVRHMCHNRLCCNPKHLKLGTFVDNWKDSEKKHRKSHKKMSKPLYINGKMYKSIRAASKMTKIGFRTLYKYMKDGVFDIQAYRLACTNHSVEPKI